MKAEAERRVKEVAEQAKEEAKRKAKTEAERKKGEADKAKEEAHREARAETEAKGEAQGGGDAGQVRAPALGSPHLEQAPDLRPRVVDMIPAWIHGGTRRSIAPSTHSNDLVMTCEVMLLSLFTIG